MNTFNVILLFLLLTLHIGVGYTAWRHSTRDGQTQTIFNQQGRGWSFASKQHLYPNPCQLSYWSFACSVAKFQSRNGNCQRLMGYCTLAIQTFTISSKNFNLDYLYALIRAVWPISVTLLQTAKDDVCNSEQHKFMLKFNLLDQDLDPIL